MKIVIFTLFAFLSSHVSSASFAHKLVDAALERTTKQVTYDGRYFSMDYPYGDVPSHLGVCTDVVIRSYRALGIDLQKLVHEDMKDNFSLYPSKRIWNLNKPDKNIDHRRVPNLQQFFQRHGDSYTVTSQVKNYQAGDLVTWMLPGNLPHIGIVSRSKNLLNGTPLIIHNIGRGPEETDVLFRYKITGHYRFASIIPSEAN